jgi:uncharacterized membrane protein YsdA (DUF1294 family)/cold shock CspA family protein
MRFEGTIKTWNEDRGFGFISPAQGGQDIFLHIKAFGTRGIRPQVGQLVSFEIELNTEGKKRAKSVEFLRPTSSSRVRSGNSAAQWGAASYFAVPAFLAIYLLVAVMWRVPHWLAGVYVGTSILAFIIYAVDKSAAEADRWRVSESTLLAVGLLGGWPGAIFAQQLLRHKSSKRSFRSAFWGTVVLNVVAFLVAFSPLGGKFVSP